MSKEHKGSLVIVLLIIALVMVLASCSDETGTSSSDKDNISAIVTAPKIDLLIAVYQNKIDIVQQHMDAGTDPNEYSRPIGMVLVHLDTVGANGSYPLHLAVVQDYSEIAQILLDNGAKIDIKTEEEAIFMHPSNKVTPLHWAAYFCRKDMVSLLIENGAPVNALDANGATPLDSAWIGEEMALARSGSTVKQRNTALLSYDTNFPQWAGCLRKLNDESEEQKLLEGIIAIIEENGGKSGKDL